MIAIVNACQGYLCMLPLVDRPFLQHVVELVVGRGATEVHVLVGDRADSVESFLGDGQRWGVRFVFHLTRDLSHPWGLLPIIAADMEEPWVMLADAQQLPCLHWQEQHGSLRWVDEHGAWTGWALLHRRDLWMAVMSPAFEQAIEETTDPVEDAKVLGIHTDEVYLSAQATVLAGGRPDLLHGGRQTAPGIWIGRGVRMHPHARLQPPLHIGDYCKIEADAQIGPGTVVGSGSIVDAAAVVQRTVVMPNTYVWPRSRVENGILWPERHAATTFHAEGSLDAMGTGQVVSAAVRQPATSAVLAFVLCLLLSPVTLVLVACLWLFRHGPVWHAREVVHSPVVDPQQEWPTFRLLSLAPHPPRWWGEDMLMHKLPGLLHVASGQLEWIGVMPRSIAEIKALPDGWRDLCLSTRPGLFQLARIDTQATEQIYAAEVCSTLGRQRIAPR